MVVCFITLGIVLLSLSLPAVRTVIQLRALSCNLSKVLERLLLLKHEEFFFSNQLQCGFKPGHSTMLCTGMVKNVITYNGSVVLSSFLDACKVFDMADDNILFRVLMDRCLPLPVLQLLFTKLVQFAADAGVWSDWFFDLLGTGIKWCLAIKEVFFHLFFLLVYLNGLRIADC